MDKKEIVLGKKPLPPVYFVDREALRRKILSAERFAFIQGGAGSGKTVLAVSAVPDDAIYVKVGEGANDTALIKTAISISRIPFSISGASLSPDEKLRVLLKYFLQNVKKRKRKFYLVVDDFHNLKKGSESLKFVKLLVQYVPENMRLIIISRKMPPVFIVRHGESGVIITEKSLNFTLNDTVKLAEKMGISDARNIAEKVFALTKGWAVGTALLLRTYREEGILKKEYLFDFLMEEVFEKLSPGIQDFLLKTALFSEISLNILQNYQKSTRKVLEQLYKNGVFISKTENGFIYHDLFKEFLVRKLKENGTYEKTAKRTALTYLKLGRREEALALSGAINDAKGINEILSQFQEREVILFADTILNATENLTQGTLNEFPRIAIVRARALLIKNKLDRALALASSVKSDEKTLADAEFLLLQILNRTGRYKEAVKEFIQSKPRIDKLKEEGKYKVYYMGSEALFYTGNYEEAQKLVSEAYRHRESVSDPFLKTRFMNAYAVLMFHNKGKYKEAIDIYRQIVGIAMERKIIIDPIIFTNLAYCEMGIGDYESTEKHIKLAMETCEKFGWSKRFTSSRIAYGYFLIEKRDFEKAESIFSTLEKEEDIYVKSAALLGLSETHRKQGKFDEALTYEEKDYKISKALKNAMFIAQSLIEIGLIYCGKKEYKKAEDALRKAIEFAKKGENIFEEARARLFLACTLFKRKKRFKRALKEAEKLVKENDFYGILHTEREYLEQFLKKASPSLSTHIETMLKEPVYIETLGTFSVKVSGKDATKTLFKREKERKIFQFLLVNFPHPVSYDTLIDAFYRSTDFKKAKHNLSVIVSNIKNAFAHFSCDIIKRHGNGYALNVSAEQADFTAFEKLSGKGLKEKDEELLKKAEQLYKGDFLTERVYDDWSTAKREILYTQYMKVLAALSELTEGEEKEVYLTKILQKDSANEEAAYALMQHYVSQGKTKKALDVYERIKAVLKEEYGLEPDETLQALYGEIVKKESR